MADQVTVTADDIGPIIAIVTWFFMVMMTLAVIFKAVIKLVVRRRLNLDDYVVCLALVFALAQSIVVSVSIQNGLGRRVSLLSQGQFDAVQKTIYAANLLFIPACGASKISLLLLVRQLAVTKRLKLITNGTIGLVAAWTAGATIAYAFHCSLPKPWDTQGRCFNAFTFWAAVGAVDLVTEIAVMALPVTMLLPVQITLAKKLTVMACFLFRIAPFIITIVRLGYLHSYETAHDISFDSMNSAIATQILISIAITTACIPSLKPFLDSFESGALRLDLSRSGQEYASQSYELSAMKRSGLRSKVRDVDESRNEGTGYLVAVSTHRPRAENGSVDSQDSDAMIIKRTDQWTVQYDDASTASH